MPPRRRQLRGNLGGTGGHIPLRIPSLFVENFMFPYNSTLRDAFSLPLRRSSCSPVSLRRSRAPSPRGISALHLRQLLPSHAQKP